LQTLLYLLVIRCSAHGGIAHIVCELSRFDRIGFQGADDVDPVQRVQVIEVHDVVVLKLRTMQQVAQDARVFWNLNPNRHFDCPHRGQGVDVRSDPAGAADEEVCIAGIASLENHFDTAEHLPGAPGIHDFATGYFHLDPEVAFNSGNRINNDSLAHIFSFPS
jgi:hypothetical protein